MLLTLLLDAAYGGGVIVYFLGYLVAIVVLFLLVMVQWSRHIELKFDRTAEPDLKRGRRLPLLLLLLVLFLLACAGLFSLFL
jgi:hypothetical protein